MESLIGNRFLFSCKQNSFLQERFCTWPRFESANFLEVGNGLFSKSFKTGGTRIVLMC